jgi:adenosylcobinamide-GDP ribazoletransferase
MQFLTIAPPVIRRLFTPQEMGRAVAFFPVIGMLLGLGLYGLDEGLRWFWSSGVTSALVLSVWILSTGALHMDGFLDSCDGLLGGRTAEDRLRIMKDERVGAYAVIGGVLLLLLKYVTLTSMEDRLTSFLLSPVLGRWSMVLAIVFFPYARPEGLGRWMHDHAGWWEVIFATLVASGACWLIAQERGLLVLGLVGGTTWLAARFAFRRLAGLTGDIYGAICEMVEVLVLLLLTARIPACVCR